MKKVSLVLVACLSAWSARAQAPRVRSVRLNAYPLSSSTLIGVDSVDIQQSAPTKVTLKQGKVFVRQLDKMLAAKDSIPMGRFKSRFVRFRFNVFYQGGTTRAIYVAQGSTLLSRGRLYRLDNELKILLRAFIPNPDEYLPVRAPRNEATQPGR